MIDEQPPVAATMPGELFKRLVDELSVLMRSDLELAVARRSPQLRRLGIEAAVAVMAAAALFLAVGAFSWAVAQGLQHVLPSWCASAVVGSLWLSAAIILIRLDHPRRLLRRLANETTGDAVARTEQDRADTEQAMKTNAEQLVRAFAKVAAELAVDESVSELEKLAGAVEGESEGVVNGLAVALRAPSKAGRSLLDVVEHPSSSLEAVGHLGRRLGLREADRDEREDED
jgi:putative superfamily III holin-X